MILRSSIVICPYFRIVSNIDKTYYNCLKYQYFCLKSPKNLFVRYIYAGKQYNHPVNLVRRDMRSFCKNNCPKVKELFLSHFKEQEENNDFSFDNDFDFH